MHGPDRLNRTRNALLSAGFELLAERPVEAVPIDELVTAAGVGKGSFFNHFGDKEGFKAAIALQIRGEVEAQIAQANAEVTDPLERLAGGMGEFADYALRNRTHTLVMLRLTAGATAEDYPLNAGVVSDLEACVAAKAIQIEAIETAVLFWLGLCVALVTSMVENALNREQAARKLEEMLVLGLTGLSVRGPVVKQVASLSAQRLLQRGDVCALQQAAPEARPEREGGV